MRPLESTPKCFNRQVSLMCASMRLTDENRRDALRVQDRLAADGRVVFQAVHESGHLAGTPEELPGPVEINFFPVEKKKTASFNWQDLCEAHKRKNEEEKI